MNKDLMVIDKNQFAIGIMDPEVKAAMTEEMEGLPVSFDRIKIPTGGGLAFEVPGDDPESPDMVKEIIGVIIDHHPINAYWEHKFEGQNNPPDCSSMDGKIGVGCPGGNCQLCQLNQFGSADDGKGKKCKNMHRVYILRSGEMFPLLLTLPPTSIKALGDYLKRNLAKGLLAHKILTKITLKKATNSTGIIYSQAQFALAGVLDREIADAMKQIQQEIKPITRKITINNADFNVIEDETPHPENIPF